MKTISLVVITVLTAVITTILLVPRIVRAQQWTNMCVARETQYLPQPKLSPAQIIWLARLMDCESNIKSLAVNPNDLDNTPSFGILQFKPSTYAWGAKTAGLASTTDYMNPEGQVAIVEHWILNGGVRWSSQFPACVKKLGNPPQQ